MNIKKRLYQISGNSLKLAVVSMLRRCKTFGLPCCLLSLGLASQAATAGIDDAKLFYRYVPYQPPAGAAGGQNAKPSSGASDAGTQKSEQGGQAAANPSQENKQVSPGEQAQKNVENPQPNANAAGNLSSSQLSEPTCASGEKAPCAGNPGAGQEAKQQEAATGTSNQSAAAGSEQQKEQGAPAQAQSQAPTQASPSGQANPSSKEMTGMSTGKVPEFAHVDANGDHYVTRDELQNYPDLLKIFDKVDAGKDGKLEQHEFQNMEMEAKREGEVL